MSAPRKYPRVPWIRPEIKRHQGLIRARRVNRLRLKFGLTQEELSILLGVSRMTVWNWEHGVHPMRVRDYDYLLLKLRGL